MGKTRLPKTHQNKSPFAERNKAKHAPILIINACLKLLDRFTEKSPVDHSRLANSPTKVNAPKANKNKLKYKKDMVKKPAFTGLV